MKQIKISLEDKQRIQLQKIANEKGLSLSSTGRMILIEGLKEKSD